MAARKTSGRRRKPTDEVETMRAKLTDAREELHARTRKPKDDPAPFSLVHHPHAGDVGATGDHGDLGTNAIKGREE